MIRVSMKSCNKLNTIVHGPIYMVRKTRCGPECMYLH